ncbi:putative bifunctional diguanylate cyclase/phosphodiesterase [Sphaerotilus sp.]|jgi:diguanylate cyclase|uniref:putative bifunctional diguanylate cyclase/phosphodiesterase n=1 Tax=Sphaerotilus sp. TaxID=2093942 RepID=UPI0025F8A11F|nr:EAL domain-containing response regulator [Sphaerotilus sp.]
MSAQHTPVLAPLSAPATPSAPTLSDVTVMMVDDEPMMTDVAQAYLEDAGYTRFVAVHDPRLALETARTHRPGLILLDLMMPELNGFDLLQLIRQDERLRYTPVIVLTAASDPASKLRALELGATEFLSKPVDASELKIRVRNSLAFKVYQDRLANDDPLTGLPNRRVFVEQLKAGLVRARCSRGTLALLHLNLDRFRQINDTLGHGTGDLLLVAVAERLRQTTRATHSLLGQRLGDSPFLARLGGDEFALLMPDIPTPEAASRVSRQVLDALSLKFHVDGQDVFLTPSIGISIFPDDGADDASLLRNAGVAMQHVKASGRNGVEFYSEKINTVSVERLLLETQLRGAIERNELVLHYQPKVDLRTGHIVGAEALLRWQHPVMGLVPPGRFIPIAEECGLIVEIGEWVIQRACAQLAQWRVEHRLAVRVAVNVARHSVVSGTLLKTTQDALQRHRVPAKQLVLELTESMLMDRVDTTATKLHELRALGVELSIDDFGTGYSSMSYLKQFPVQELKIDRSFVKGTPQDRTDTAIVRALVVLGHSLGMRVVAEGVETEDQRAAMQSLHCDCYQGFLCSPALPAEQFIAKVREVNGMPMRV